MIRLIYIISDIEKALAFEWIADHLDREKFELKFVLLNSEITTLEYELIQKGISVTRIRTDRGWRLSLSLFRLILFLRKEKPDIIHTHLRYASLLGILAGWLTRVKVRIHTRHHSTSNHTYFPHAVKTDKFVSFLSTKIVAISNVVKCVLVDLEGVEEAKVEKIPHGFDLDYFAHVNQDVRRKLHAQYLPNEAGPVIGMISRYLELKGVEYGISAFAEIRKEFPKAHLILANAKGPYRREIELGLDLLPSDSYTEIPFEENLRELYSLLDVYLHIPIDAKVEAFGQTYVEALLCSVPSVFTLSGIAHELIQDEFNALVVSYEDSRSTAFAITRLLKNEQLRKKLIHNGNISAKDFSLTIYIKQLESLYESAVAT